MNHLVSFIVLLLFSFSCSEEHPEIFNAKYVKLLPDATRMMLIENVVIRYGDLYAEADSALLEKPKQTVTVYAIRKASFNGKDIPAAELKGIVRYRKGDAILHSE